MEPADPFVIQGRPFIDDLGDFRVLDAVSGKAPVSESKAADVKKVLDLIAENPKISARDIRKATGGFGFDKIKLITKKAGLKNVAGVWKSTKDEDDSAL
jgi:hypothetical protein